MRTTLVLLSETALVAGLAGCGSEPKPQAAPTPPGATVAAEPAKKPVSEMSSGWLGFPLGTYLTVEGVREDEGKVGTQTLLVDTVNGRKLNEPVPIWVENVRDPGLPAKERCVIRGYESGRMIGLPDGVRKVEKDLPPTQAAWQFYRFFVITSVVQPASLQRGELYSDESVTAWAGRCLAITAALKPSMTRQDLLRVYAVEGGLSTRTRRTYAYAKCPYVKIDVEFKPSGPGNEEQPTDVIVNISRPYLQLPVSD